MLREGLFVELGENGVGQVGLGETEKQTPPSGGVLERESAGRPAPIEDRPELDKLAWFTCCPPVLCPGLYR